MTKSGYVSGTRNEKRKRKMPDIADFVCIPVPFRSIFLFCFVAVQYIFSKARSTFFFSLDCFDRANGNLDVLFQGVPTAS